MNYKKLIALFIFFTTFTLYTQEVTIGFMGDVMLGRLVGKKLQENKSFNPWGNLLPLLQSTDFNMANLETTFSNDGIPVPKVFNFQSDPSNVTALLQANIQLVNLANNHILDYGRDGFMQTLNTLNDAHIQHVGAGLTSKEAQQPTFITVNGITFGFLGFTDNYEPGWAATSHKAGVNYIVINEESFEQIKPIIADAKKQADFLVVSLHWGPNWDERPSRAFQKFAHRLIDHGVDLIHGHSAHIFQGMELYKNKLILYSCGDFLDDYALDKRFRNDQSFLFLTTFDQLGLKEVRLVPVMISNMQVNKALPGNARAMISRMDNLSLELGTVIPRNGVWKRSPY